MRQAKEVAGQKKLDVDAARAELLALMRANWGALQAAKTQIAAAQAQIDAAERALYGVREEAKAGQRTTLDILNAQQELLGARIGRLRATRPGGRVLCGARGDRPPVGAARPLGRGL